MGGNNMIAGRYALILALIAVLFVQPAFSESRVALVIGNGGYIGQPRLPNPPNDAQDIAAALEALGFKVIQGTNLTKADFDAKLHEFSRSTTGADVAFFFYSGHGMQINGINYLIPIDAPLTKEDLDFQTVTLDFVQKLLERAKTKVIILDACRNNPYAEMLGQSLGTRAINANAGLAVATAPDLGYFIAFATQPGHVASDGAGRNSPFTSSLKAHIATPGLSISDLMIVVRNDVVQATNGAQIPWDHSALSMRFYFKEGPATEVADAGQKSSDAAEAWGWVRDTSNPEALQQFITLYGDSPLAPQAKMRLATLKQSQPRAASVTMPLGGNAPMGPSKPSFDCRAHHSDAEVTICNKPELCLLDNKLDHLYARALKTVPEAKRNALVSEQRDWLKARDDCATRADCLAEKYGDRIQKLKAAFHAAAAPAPEVRPSFDCSTSQLPAEVAVCSHPELAELDLELDRLYTAKLKQPGALQRPALVVTQRHWGRNRGTCAGNVDCLKIQYKARIQQLSQ